MSEVEGVEDEEDREEDEEDEEELNDEEEDDVTPRVSTIDWGALFAKAGDVLAENEDNEDDDLTPPQKAAKILREDKQSYWIKTIRDINGLMDSHPEETIRVVFPQLQSTLCDQKSNLDLHCEAAVLYKDLVKKSVEENNESLPLLLLHYIIDNAHTQKDNLSAAAWLETLTEITPLLPVESVRDSIVPVFISQADPNQKVQRRLTATKLLEKLVRILPVADIRRSLEKPMQLLSCDDNSNVRSSMAQRLTSVADALDKPSDMSRLVLPCLISLGEDTEQSVRDEAIPSLVNILPCLSREAKKSVVMGFFRRVMERGIEKKDDRVLLITKHFGQIVHLLYEDVDILDQTWMLNTFFRLTTLSRNEEGSKWTTVRRACAFNLPCMIKTFPKATTRLLTLLQDFCADHDDEVRLTISASFGELLEMSNDRKAMIGPFIELLRGGSLEVVAKTCRNLEKIVPMLYSCLKGTTPSHPLSTKSIDRLLLGCNQLLEGTGSWRSHEALLSSISSLPALIPSTNLIDTFVPLLKKEILKVRGVPCREAASRSLLLIMRHLPRLEDRLNIISFFQNDVAHHSNSYRRMIFLSSILQVFSIFSNRFLHEHFLSTALSLAEDPVSNIRLKVCSILPLLKRSFVLPEDDEKLKEVEGKVRRMIEREKGIHTLPLLNQHAIDLSRAETGRREDKENMRKEKEENELWNEEREREGEEEMKREEDNQKTSLFFSRRSRIMSRSLVEWRTERRSIALVRPQPVVCLRSSSPAPPSRSSTPSIERKSRLPLATSPVTREPSNPSSASFDRRRAQSESRTMGVGSNSSSSSSFAISKSQSSSHLRRPSFALSKVSSSSNIERRPASMSMRIRNINIL